MKYDEIVTSIGQFGKYQKIKFALLCLPIYTMAVHTYVFIYLLAVPSHRCALPQLENDTFTIQSLQQEAMINSTIPVDINGQFSKCEIYNGNDKEIKNSEDYRLFDGGIKNRNGENIFEVNNLAESKLLNRSIRYQNGANRSVTSCNRWVYDRSTFQSSVVTELDLVCESRWAIPQILMYLMLGRLFGVLILGPQADRFGRKKLLMFTIIFHIIFSFLIAFTSSFIYLCIITLFHGAFLATLYGIAYVIGMELVGPQKRMYIGFIATIVYAIGGASVSGFAFFIRDWKQLQFVLSALTIPFLSYFWLIPESPRWLISRGRYSEAKVILDQAAKVNGHGHVREEFLHREEKATAVPAESMLNLFRYPQLLIRSLIIIFNFTVCAMIYHGISLNVGTIPGSIYVKSTIYGIVEVMSYLICIPLMDRLGRRRMQILFMFLAGLGCIISPLPYNFGGDDYQWLTVALANIGKFGVSGAFSVIWIYGTELFPTSIRNSGLSASSMSAGLGGAISSYIGNIGLAVGGRLGEILPFIIWGSVALLAAVMVLYLPETKNTKMPDTLSEAAAIGGKRVLTESPVQSRIYRPVSGGADMEMGDKEIELVS